MKKLGILVMPLVAISLLASCNKGGGDNPERHDITISLSEEASKELTLEPLVVESKHNYRGTITLKNSEKGLVVNSCNVKVANQELMIGRDFTVDYQDTNSGNRQYRIEIPGKYMTDDVIFSATVDNEDSFKVDSLDEIDSILKFNDVTNALFTKHIDDKKVYNDSTAFESFSFTNDTFLDIKTTLVGREETRSFLTSGDLCDNYIKTPSFSLYGYSHEVDYFTTPSNCDLTTYMQTTFNVCKSRINFNENSLSYEFWNYGRLVNSFQLNNDHIIKFIDKDHNIGFCSYFIYGGQKPIAKPSPSDCYNVEEVKYQISKQEWTDLFTLGETPNLGLGLTESVYTGDKYSSSSSYLIYDDNKYFNGTYAQEFDSQTGETEFYQQTYFDVENDDYISYDYNFDNHIYTKKHNQKDAYNEKSYQNVVLPIFDIFLSNYDLFDFVEYTQVVGYISDKISGFASAFVSIEKVISMGDPNHVECAITMGAISVSDSETTYFIPYTGDEVHIDMPIVD